MYSKEEGKNQITGSNIQFGTLPIPSPKASVGLKILWSSPKSLKTSIDNSWGHSLYLLSKRPSIDIIFEEFIPQSRRGFPKMGEIRHGVGRLIDGLQWSSRADNSLLKNAYFRKGIRRKREKKIFGRREEKNPSPLNMSPPSMLKVKSPFHRERNDTKRPMLLGQHQSLKSTFY